MLARSLAVLIACSLLPAAASGQRGSGGGHSASVARPSHINGWGPTNSGLPSPTLVLPDVVSTRRAQDERKVDFKSETVMVQVPVVVTDKAGDAVRHLARDDFRLLENGKLQKIASFEEITATGARPSPPAAPGEFSNLAAAGEEARALTVIALDTVNTPYLDQRYGREQLLKYLAAHLQPSQPLALVMITSRGLQVIQDFTDQPERLLRVLKRVTGEMPPAQGDNLQALAEGADIGYAPLQSANAQALMQSFLDAGDVRDASFHQANAIVSTLQAFLDMAWALSGIRGRKSIIWVTGSFPFELDSPDTVPGGDLSLLYERTFQELNQANVAVYPVDARGLVDPITDFTSRTRPAPEAISARAWLHANTLETLSLVAAMTGGRAFVNTNDLAGSFQRAMKDSASYYMLGYYLDTSDRRPGWRKLQVSVARQGLQVRARDGFFVTNATVNALLTADMDLSYALSSPFDATAVPLDVRFLGETPKGKDKEIAFHVHIPPSGMSVSGGDNQFDMDFVALAAASRSKLSPHLAQNIRGRLPSSEMAAVRATGFGFSKKLDLPPGRYLLRFVVRDNLSGRVGSVSAPVIIN